MTYSYLSSILLIIPVPVVYPLSQELYRRDGPALILLGEVEVINEYDALLPHGGAVYTLPPPVQL